MALKRQTASAAPPRPYCELKLAETAECSQQASAHTMVLVELLTLFAASKPLYCHLILGFKMPNGTESWSD